MAFPTGYSKYQEVTIDYTKVAADLTDFIIYVDLASLSKAGADIFDTCRTDGGDIRVTKSDGVTELAREVVAIDTTAKTGELHVKFTGTLSSSVNTVIRIWYNGTDTEPAVTDTYGRNNVWTDYWAVYHLQDATVDAVDSTGGGATATKNGTPTSVTGAFGAGSKGKGADLDGSTEWYRTANNALAVGSGGTGLAVSMSIWWKQSITTYKVPLSIDPGDTAQRYFIQLQTQNGDAFAESGGNAGASIAASYTASLNDSAWHLHRWNHSNPSNVAGELYVDGVSRATTSGTAAFDWQAYLDVVVIGATDNWDSATISHPFQGSVDEARLRKSIVSDQWDTTEYNNQSSPSTFYTVGDELTGGGVTVSATVQAATFSIPTYTPKSSSVIAPATQVDTFSIPTYTTAQGVRVTANAQVATFTIPAYTATSGATIVQPNTQAMTFSIPAYNSRTYVIVMPNGQELTYTLPARTINVTAFITITPTTVSLVITTVGVQRIGAVWRKSGRNSSGDWTRISRNSD